MHKPAFNQALLTITALFLWLCGSPVQAGTATLSGTITEAGTGTPLAGVTVITAPQGFIGVEWTAETDALGAFTLEVSIDPSHPYTLFLEAAGPNHAPKRYNGSPATDCYFICGGGDGGIELNDGDSITNLDFALEPGGRFAGRVTAASDDSPLELARVSPRRSEGPIPINFSTHFDGVSDASGNYESELALMPGDYHLLASPRYGDNYVQQAWQNYPCQLDGCPIFDTDTVAITAGAINTDLDFSLQTGATISGTLKPADETKFVYLYDGTGMMFSDPVFLNPSETEWSFNGLAGGSYYVQLGTPTGRPFVRQLHNGLLCPYSGCDRASGVPITIPPGSTLGLSETVLRPGGMIEGSIVDASTGSAPPTAGLGNSLGTYDIIKADGTIVGGGPIMELNGEIKLAASAAVPAGNYYVRTFNNWTGEGIGFGSGLQVPGYSDAMYPDVACAGQRCNISTAQAVAVADNATTTITIEISTGSSISGVVVDDDSGDPMGQTLIKLIDADGSPLASTQSNNLGEFSFGGFPPGDYFLRTSVAGVSGPGTYAVIQHRYFDQLHGGPARCSEMLCDPSSGSAITLDGTTDTGPLTLRIQPGPVISGRITAALTGTLIHYGSVEVYDDSGALVGEFRINPWTGRYQTVALAPGDYTLVPAISPAFSGATVAQNHRSLKSDARTGHSNGSLVVTMGTEDVNADMLVVDRALDSVFKDTFHGN